MDDPMAMKRPAGVDENAGMKRKAYEKELRKLQVELCHLQAWVKAKGARIIIVFGAAMPRARAAPSRPSPNG
jgi:polyphosphate kinase 2 (PPK2 family)